MALISVPHSTRVYPWLNSPNLLVKIRRRIILHINCCTDYLGINNMNNFFLSSFFFFSFVLLLTLKMMLTEIWRWNVTKGKITHPIIIILGYYGLCSVLFTIVLCRTMRTRIYDRFYSSWKALEIFCKLITFVDFLLPCTSSGIRKLEKYEHLIIVWLC